MSKAREEYEKSIFKKYLPDQEKIAFWYIKELEETQEKVLLDLLDLYNLIQNNQPIPVFLLESILKDNIEKITGKSIEEVLKDE